MPAIIYRPGTNDAMVFPLSENTEFQLGRGALNALSFPGDQSVSRYHCEIVYDRSKNAFVFRDLHSRNGSMVGTTLIKGQSVELTRDTPIRIGNIELAFSLDPLYSATETVSLSLMSAPVAAAPVPPPENVVERAPMVSAPAAEAPPRPKVLLTAKRAAPEPSAAMAGVKLNKGDKLGNFEIMREIGRGNRGVVFLANQTTLNRVVAIKVFYGISPEEREAFAGTIRAVGALNHQHVTPYFDIGEIGDGVYVTMPYYANGNLDAHIGATPVSEEKALTYILALAEGLDAAYNGPRLTHLNIKGANIFFDDDGLPSLADMGPGNWLSTHAVEDGKTWLPGGEAYVSPERVVEAAVDWRADLYALGVLVFRLLTGALPFTGKSDREIATARVQKAFPAPKDVNPAIEISPKMEELLRRMIARDPEERFTSWASFIEQAKNALSSLKQPVKPAAPAKAPASAAPQPKTLAGRAAVAGKTSAPFLKKGPVKFKFKH